MEYLKHLRIEDLKEEQKELAETIGLQSYIKLMKNFGGSNIYIHKPERANIIARNKLIINDFTGYNYRELAKKYNLSKNALKQIISENK